MFAIVLLAGMTLVAAPAQASFRQARSYPNYSYNPYRYGYQDTISQLIQSHLNFVANFTYIPAPTRYFYNSYSPYNYYGGYNYGY